MITSAVPAQGVTQPVPLLAVPSVVSNDDAGDLVDLLFLEPFSAGREPFSRSRSLDDVADTVTCLPDEGRWPYRLIRDSGSEHAVRVLLRGAGWSARILRNPRRSHLHVTVTSTGAELADAVLASIVRDALPEPPDPEQVGLAFWHRAAGGARRTDRVVRAPAWGEVRGNYAARVATALDPLLALRPDDVGGHLLLLHGPPGTGKSTLLRSLAREWQDWCSVDCVLDPDRLFDDPSYLLDVALGTESGYRADEQSPRPWRLLLLEDCDELIRAEAKSATGQQLSRLLNLTDGLLGQGRNVLVAITTNEPLATLHPAVTRPGRALASVEVGSLPPAEAQEWLARRGASSTVGPDGATLAELFAAAAGRGGPVRVDAPPAEVGLYL